MTLRRDPLHDKLERRIHQRTGRRVRGLSIELGAAGIVLRGQAQSYYIKQLAQQGVREILPEASLQNAIEVGG